MVPVVMVCSPFTREVGHTPTTNRRQRYRPGYDQGNPVDADGFHPLPMLPPVADRHSKLHSMWFAIWPALPRHDEYQFLVDTSPIWPAQGDPKRKFARPQPNSRP